MSILLDKVQELNSMEKVVFFFDNVRIIPALDFYSPFLFILFSVLYSLCQVNFLRMFHSNNVENNIKMTSWIEIFSAMFVLFAESSKYVFPLARRPSDDTCCHFQ